MSKAIAMIFVYLGHWTTMHLEAFAYGFHLQLFFLVSGFFAIKTSERKFDEWLLRKIKSLMIPYFLWVVISFIFVNLDNADNIVWKNIFLTPDAMQPNYWFFPAIIAVTLCYYLLYKVIKKPIYILIVAFVLHLLFGETPLINYNLFEIINKVYPVWVVSRWIGISAIPQYLFWYALGAVSFNKIKTYTECMDHKPIQFYAVGFISGIVSMILFFHNITNIRVIQKMIYINNGILECYRIVCSIVIIVFVFFVSKLLENSNVMKDIGASSLNFMGLEYITHGYFALSLLPMLNLGIPTVSSTMHVITLSIIQVVINLWISRKINKYMPVLNGDWK